LISAGAPTQTPLGELTAKGRDGEGEERKGRGQALKYFGLEPPRHICSIAKAIDYHVNAVYVVRMFSLIDW